MNPLTRAPRMAQADPVAAHSAAGIGLPNPKAHKRRPTKPGAFFLPVFRPGDATHPAVPWRSVRGSREARRTLGPVVQPAPTAALRLDSQASVSVTQGDPTMNTQHHDILAASYALARHLPALAAGFSICTTYGELHITAAEAARHPAIRHEVESILRYRLHLAERGQEVQS